MPAILNTTKLLLLCRISNSSPQVLDVFSDVFWELLVLDVALEHFPGMSEIIAGHFDPDGISTEGDNEQHALVFVPDGLGAFLGLPVLHGESNNKNIIRIIDEIVSC